MKVNPTRVAAEPQQKRGALAPYLIGISDYDSLAVRGYTRLIDSPDIAMAVGRLADIVSDATIQLMKNTPEGDVRQKNELSKFLDIHPYSLGTRKSFISWIVTYMLTAGSGNAFVLPNTKNGYLMDLIPMPGAIAISADNDTSYKVLWKGQYFAPDEVLHFAYRPDLSRPWLGRGIEVQLKDVLKNLRQAAATTNGFMSEKWKPSLIIKVDALSDEFSDAAGRRRLLDEYVSNQSAGEPWVIPSELIDVKEVKPLSLADLAISDSVDLDKRSVAGMIGVPSFFVGIGSFNQDEYNFTVRTTVKSIANIITQEMSKKIILSPDMYVRLNEWKLYSYSAKELKDIGCDLYIRGISSGNEVRDLISWDPVKGLDERVILENFIPQGMIGDQKKLNQKGEPSND